MRVTFLNIAPGYDEGLHNSVFLERGLHATSICGAAVAVRCCRGRARRGSPPPGSRSAWAPRLLETNRTGGTVKRVDCGWAAHYGVAAADLARHGLTGPPTVLEGRFGFV